jgi:hypothetical protein
MPIDDKPIKSEINILKNIISKFSDLSDGVFGGVFDLIRRFKVKESSILHEVSNKSFIEESAMIISDLISRNSNGLIVSFDLRVRELSEKITALGINLHDLFFIDCVSYCQGKGTPPVFNIMALNSRDDFENITYYSLIQLRIMTTLSPFVIILSPHTLLDISDYNEIGMFFQVYVSTLERKGIPIIFIYDETADPILKRILSDLVPKKKLLE